MHDDRIAAAPYLGSSTFLSGMVNHMPQTDPGQSKIRAAILDKLAYIKDISSTATLTESNADDLHRHIELNECPQIKNFEYEPKSKPNHGIFYLGGSQEDPDDVYSDTGKQYRDALIIDDIMTHTYTHTYTHKYTYIHTHTHAHI